MPKLSSDGWFRHVSTLCRQERRVGKAAGRERVRRRAHRISAKPFDLKKWWARRQERLCPPYGPEKLAIKLVQVLGGKSNIGGQQKPS
jgi:hypothetical protein